MNNILDTFLVHPIFMGINRGAILKIFEKNNLKFVKYRDGELIAEKDTPNNVLICILSGGLKLVSKENDHITLTEELSAPQIIAPDFYFGFDVIHPKSVYAVGSTGTFEIERSLLYKLSKENEIIFMNLLNMTSRRSQQKSTIFENSYMKGEKHKLQTWILSKSNPGSKNVKIEAKIKDLTRYFGVSAQSLKHEIEVLTDLEIIKGDSGLYILPERERLLEHFVKKRDL